MTFTKWQLTSKGEWWLSTRAVGSRKWLSSCVSLQKRGDQLRPPLGILWPTLDSGNPQANDGGRGNDRGSRTNSWASGWFWEEGWPMVSVAWSPLHSSDQEGGNSLKQGFSAGQGALLLHNIFWGEGLEQIESQLQFHLCPLGKQNPTLSWREDQWHG